MKHTRLAALLAMATVGILCSMSLQNPSRVFAVTEAELPQLYLHTTNAGSVLNDVTPTAVNPQFKDSPVINRQTYRPIGTWVAAPATVPVILTALGGFHIWLGLKNSDDQGTNFDVRVEVLKNGHVVSTGETKNVVGVTRNPSLATGVIISFGSVADAALKVGDVLAVGVSAKVADNGGHSSATGLRIYYDALAWKIQEK